MPTFTICFLLLLRFYTLSFVFVVRLDTLSWVNVNLIMERFHLREKINFFINFLCLSRRHVAFLSKPVAQIKKSSLITQSDRATFHECTPGVMSPVGRLEIDRPVISPLTACYTYPCVREHHRIEYRIDIISDGRLVSYYVTRNEERRCVST